MRNPYAGKKCYCGGQAVAMWTNFVTQRYYCYRHQWNKLLDTTDKKPKQLSLISENYHTK